MWHLGHSSLVAVFSLRMSNCSCTICWMGCPSYIELFLRFGPQNPVIFLWESSDHIGSSWICPCRQCSAGGLNFWLSSLHSLVRSLALIAVLCSLPHPPSPAASGRIMMTGPIVRQPKQLADTLLVTVVHVLGLLLLHEIPPLCACLRRSTWVGNQRDPGVGTLRQGGFMNKFLSVLF